jgi:dimethylargininase
MPIALTRRISPSISRCELTHLSREPIDYARACAQHAQYEDALRSLGVEVVSLPAEPDLPDSVFVEDAALVLDDCAVMTRPGAESRRPESVSVEAALAPYRDILHIEPPGTLDGGDILVIGRTIYVGVTSRSTREGIDQLETLVGPRGYTVQGLAVKGCLHLKSAATLVGADTVLLNPAWVLPDAFPRLRILEIDPTEPYAANAVLVGDTIIYPSSFPKTQAILAAAHINIVTVDADELAKAEGAVTCCSLLFEV